MKSSRSSFPGKRSQSDAGKSKKDKKTKASKDARVEKSTSKKRSPKKSSLRKAKAREETSSVRKRSSPKTEKGRPTKRAKSEHNSSSENKNTFSKRRPFKRKGIRKISAIKESSPTDKVRLNKFIANSGICSRREADELIQMGLISVNGKVITELGYKVEFSDRVKYNSKSLKAEKPVYILLNKPKGYITTTKDPQERKTVMNLLGGKIKERVYPVGRLDRNTTGLLLLTNDGEVADKLSHPSYQVRKLYKVELDRALTKADFEKIISGVSLAEGKAMVDDLAIVSDDKKTVGLELHIGWNRVVRRIFEALDYTVLKLDRTIYAGLDKKDLPRGHWRFLDEKEVVKLKYFKK